MVACFSIENFKVIRSLSDIKKKKNKKKAAASWEFLMRTRKQNALILRL